jgi:transposase InsO family protein
VLAQKQWSGRSLAGERRRIEERSRERGERESKRRRKGREKKREEEEKKIHKASTAARLCRDKSSIAAASLFVGALYCSPNNNKNCFVGFLGY